MLLKVKYIIIFNTWGKKQLNENSINYVSLVIPMSMSNYIPMFPLTENNVPIIDDVPMVKGMPIGEDVPIVEKTPIIKYVQINKELFNWKSQKISHKIKKSFSIGTLWWNCFKNKKISFYYNFLYKSYDFTK